MLAFGENSRACQGCGLELIRREDTVNLARHRVRSGSPVLRTKDEWADLLTLVLVESTRRVRDKVTTEVRCYISSRAEAGAVEAFSICR